MDLNNKKLNKKDMRFLNSKNRSRNNNLAHLSHLFLQDQEKLHKKLVNLKIIQLILVHNFIKKE